jgi:exodeoxyribonuclease VII large subunit
MRFTDDRMLTVSAINRAVRLGLESEWGDVWVVGEISDLTRSAAGHLYFTLNDEREAAQLRTVIFQGDARRSRATFEEGARIRVRGRLSLYEPRGTFQMIARAAAAAGEGDLVAQFRKLLAKLEAEGLTAEERKRPLPLWPRCVGVVTSDQGAAIHDIIQVACRRCPVRIVIAPCVVQGPEAPASILRALRDVQKLPDLDVVIMARGGGAAEDLWAFNDERIARAIVACRVPVVSGVGHEVDITIADLVADVRAATPSQAAELVVPDANALDERLRNLSRRLARTIETKIDRAHVRLHRFANKLRDPRHALASTRGRLDALDDRLARVTLRRVSRERARLEQLTRRLSQQDPRARLVRQRAALQTISLRLSRSHAALLSPRQRVLATLAARLDALSPLAVLSRGYAIAFSERTERAIRSASELETGDVLRIRFDQGQARARVE